MDLTTSASTHDSASTSVTVFTDGELNELRAIEVNGSPWFVAADICNGLGLTNTSSALKALDADEKAKAVLSGRVCNLVSEAGLHHLILRTNKPGAKGFHDWVTSTVLPTLGDRGLHEKPLKPAHDDDTLAMAQGLFAAKRIIEGMRSEMDQLSQQYQPVLDLITAEGGHTVRFAAECVRAVCPSVREEDVFSYLREKRLMAKRTNAPTQLGIDRGLLVPAPNTYRDSKGRTHTREPYAHVTGKGIAMLIEHFCTQHQPAPSV